MDYAATLSAVRGLNREDQVRLIEEVQSELDGDFGGELDDETKRLLDERWAEHQANPQDAIPLDQAMAEIRAELRR